MTLSQASPYTSCPSQWAIVNAVTAAVDRKHFWHVARNERIYKLLQTLVPNNADKSFLEIGSGVGNVVGFLHGKGMKHLSGWEINPEALAIARSRYPSVKFESHDLQNHSVSMSGKSYDIVGLFDVLEHVEDDLDCLCRVFELLKPGGLLLLTVPAHSLLWSWHDEVFGHFRRYERRGLLHAVRQAGYRSCRAFYFMAPLVPLVLLNRKLYSKSRPSTLLEIEQMYVRESGLPHPALNFAMLATLRLETWSMPMCDLGFGSSLVCCAFRPA